MIDSYLRTPYQRWCVEPVLGKLVSWRLKPGALTLGGVIAGLLSFTALVEGFSWVAVGLLVISGYLDTLDGSLARARGGGTAHGAVNDIVADRFVEFLLILGLFLVDPVSRGFWALMMLGSVLLCVTTFLVVGIFMDNQSDKSFHYSPGVMERTEAFLLFGLMMLLPGYFSFLAALFSGLVFLTALLRLRDFRMFTTE